MKERKIAPTSVVENGIEYFEKESIDKLYKEEYQQRLKSNVTKDISRCLKNWQNLCEYVFRAL